MKEYLEDNTFAAKCSEDRIRIVEALEGKVSCENAGQSEAFVCKDACQKRIQDEILYIYDDCAQQAKIAMAALRVMERMLEESNITVNMQKFGEYFFEDLMDHDDFDLIDLTNYDEGDCQGNHVPCKKDD